jgi:hypothetical protein
VSARRLRRSGRLLLALALSSACTSTDVRRSVSPPAGPSTAKPISISSPGSYAETCRLVASWCGSPAHGAIPPPLVRPLAFPPVDAANCPVDSGRSFTTEEFGGIAFGNGPVRPLVVQRDADAALDGTFRFVASKHGWYVLKTLWFATPRYKGSILIRGRQLDGENPLAFGEDPQLLDPQLPRGKTLNGSHGFRTWPGGTWVRAPGCYGWQVDGTNFSRTIVFRAELV